MYLYSVGLLSRFSFRMLRSTGLQGGFSISICSKPHEQYYTIGTLLARRVNLRSGMKAQHSFKSTCANVDVKETHVHMWM